LLQFIKAQNDIILSDIGAFFWFQKRRFGRKVGRRRGF